METHLAVKKRAIGNSLDRWITNHYADKGSKKQKNTFDMCTYVGTYVNVYLLSSLIYMYNTYVHVYTCTTHIYFVFMYIYVYI